jgi:hypothetical protein
MKKSGHTTGHALYVFNGSKRSKKCDLGHFLAYKTVSNPLVGTKNI